MGDGQEIDVEQIMEWLREDIKKRRQQHVGGIKTTRFPDDELAADFASLHAAYDIYNLQFTSHRRIIGPFVIFVKKLLRQLLTPILTHQVTYNAVNTRVATQLGEKLAALNHQAQTHEELLTSEGQAVQAMQAQLTAFGQQMQQREDRLTAHAEALQAVQAQLTAFGQQMQLREDRLAAHAEALQAVQAQLTAFGQQMRQREDVLAAHAEARQEHLNGRLESLDQQQRIGLQSMRERVSKAERKLRRVLYVLTDDQMAGERLKIERKVMPSQALEPNFDYFGFEEKFRGSEEDIKARQGAYLEYFQGQNDILDIGCGRGEFLELLREAGTKVKGVDLDLDMVLYCREKGLDVVQEDGFTYLDSLPDEALGGIFAAQVIEHLESNQIIELVKLCRRKLRPGGILILETLNPKCLMIFAESFYMDFSHIKPIHPEAMKFLFESTGFFNVELRFSAPVEPSKRILPLPNPEVVGTTLEGFNRSLEQLNELLYGFQDYAVIGRK
jgi:2-polyprenyl-3-methyl-5-hydroxy-6-metoxy-1,4-benzoquinol methylase